jgi:5-methyltetrahydrofolate--homocysteine methyltransferase
MDIVSQISEALLKGENEQVYRLTKQAIDIQIPIKIILDDGLIGGMTVVGQKFKAHEIFLPEVLMAAKAMYVGMDLLKPHLIAGNVPTLGRVVLGTVQGDLHDIGKNLVGIMLKGAGFEIIDLGNDVPPVKFINSAVASKAKIIGLSALLTTTMPMMKKVTDLINERGLYGQIKVIVGGAPLNENYARSIGADAYAYDGINAVEKVKNLLEIN